MATLQSILSAARSGMSVSQTAAGLVSRNIANAQTPGYAREILPIAAALGGLAVTSGPPVAMRAALLERALQGANGRVGYHESQSRHLSIAEAALNDLDGTGLGARLDDFREALSSLSANPSGTAERSTLLSQANTLGASFASTRRQLDQAASGTRDEAVATTAKVNSLAAEIAQIDQRIKSARPGEEINTYLARRSALVGTLSGLVDVDVRQRTDGTLHVSTAGGRSLVEGGEASKMVVEIGQPPARALTVSFERPDGSRLAAISGSELGGELGGLVKAHDETLAPALEKLDKLAFDLMNAFNAQHANGFTPSGAQGGDFFTPPATADGAASRMTLVAGIQPGDVAASTNAASGAGDNTNVLALYGLLTETGALPDGSSVNDFWRGIGSDVSHAQADAKAGAAFETGSRDQIENLLASETGVSIDEEMFQLTQAQTALEASTRVISEAQKMTDTVLSLVG